MSIYCNKNIKLTSISAIFVKISKKFVTFSTLKMILYVEKTLKISIQKKLPKSQKFARKVSAAEFRSSQTAFLRFTITLCHSNLDEKITSKK